jgi:hypothetical protein
MTSLVFACRVFGHRYRFHADGTELVWTCERGCGVGGQKSYPTAERAQRYALVFDKRDNAETGRRTPLLGMLPLRLWRWLRRRGSGPDSDAHGT